MMRARNMFTRGLTLLLAIPIVVAPPVTAAPLRADQHVPGEVLLRFADKTSERQLESTLRLLGSRHERIGYGSVTRLQLQSGSRVDSVIDYLSGLEGVAIVQPNYRYRFAALPNDPEVDQQWAVANTGQTILGASIYPFNNPGTPGSDLGLTDAWNVRSDCRGVVVAVIDSGVAYAHADLAAAMWDGSPTYPNHGWDTAGSGDDDPAPDTGIAEDDHGTHVAGIVGAIGDNATGITGICWQAEIMAIRAGSFASGLTTADVIEGIAFAIDNGASIMNMSFGGELPFDPLFSAAIDDARDAGVLVVAAAGNDGVDVDGSGADGLDTTRFYPCAFPQDNVVCVAASDQADEWALFSSYGATSVDLAAPGTNVLSTTYFDGFDVMSGTSMATPQASGIAALIWAHNPAYGYREVRSSLLDSSRAAGAWSGLTVTGGVVDADRAIRLLQPPTGLSYTLD